MAGKIEYLLDTDCVSSLIDAPRGPVERRVRQVGRSRIAISIIVAAELRYSQHKQGSVRLTALTAELLGGLGGPALRTSG